MLNGKRFRLLVSTAGVESVNGKRVAVFVPAQATIKVVSDAQDSSGMVDVLWDGRIVSMFAVDVEERGEQIMVMTSGA